MRQTTTKQRLQVILGLVFSAICLAAIFLFIDVADVVASLQSADYRYLLLAAPLIVAYLALRAVRWRVLLNGDVPLGEVFHIQNIGYMLTQLLPLRLGDVARAVLIGSVPPVTIARGLSTMVVERVLDLLVIVTLLPLAVAQLTTVSAEIRSVGQTLGVAALLGTGVLIVAANFRPAFVRLARGVFGRISFLDTDRWTGVVDDLLLGLSALTQWRSGLTLLFWSVALWLPMVFAYYTTMLAVRLDVGVVTAVFVMCAAALSIAAPSSPAQVGVFHAGVIAALALIGHTGPEAASFAFLYHALNFVVVLVVGVIGVWRTSGTIGAIVEKAWSFARGSA